MARVRGGRLRRRWSLPPPLTSCWKHGSAMTLSPQAGRGRSGGGAYVDGAFGDVALAGMQLAHGAPAQALLQAVDQPGEFLGRGGCLGVVSKTRLRVVSKTRLRVGAVREDQLVLALGQVLG